MRLKKRRNKGWKRRKEISEIETIRTISWRVGTRVERIRR